MKRIEEMFEELDDEDEECLCEDDGCDCCH